MLYAAPTTTAQTTNVTTANMLKTAETLVFVLQASSSPSSNLLTAYKTTDIHQQK